MAQRPSSGSRTTTLESSNGKEPTLILRLRQDLAKVEKNIVSSILEVGKKLNADIKGSKDKDTKQTIQQSLEIIRAQYNQQLDRIHEEILAREPKEPVRKECQSEEEFQQKQQKYEKELQEYSDFVDISTSLVDGVVELITKAIDKLSKYSDFVWNLIKAKDKDMDKKCKGELKRMADEMHSATDSVDVPKINRNASHN